MPPSRNQEPPLHPGMVPNPVEGGKLALMSETTETLSRDKIYAELCADFRALNSILWQMPILLMTLTGGLWFAVASLALSAAARSDLLRFAGLADLLMIVALFRLRWVMARVQERIRALDGGKASKVNYVIVCIFAVLLALAAFGSFRASGDLPGYFPGKSPAEQLHD